jgi:3-oxoadipate enol-lactonase
MPKKLINGVEIHYELDGRGEEVLVILNGIMMSTASWVEHVPFFTANGLRVLRVDFRDQGQSGKAAESYPIAQHVEDLAQLLSALDLGPVHLHGISYGGQVALLFALQYPDQVRSLIVANTVARLTNYLKGIGESWDEAARLKNGHRFFRLVMPMIYSNLFFESHWEWLKEREAMFGELLTAEWFDSYLRLSASHGDEFNLLERLPEIKKPTLIIAADRDAVTPVEEMRAIKERIAGARFVMIPDSGHASCYEKMAEYTLLILGFIALLK